MSDTTQSSSAPAPRRPHGAGSSPDDAANDAARHTDAQPAGDPQSRGSVGGTIPGRTGSAAYSHSAPRAMPLPVLIAVPHAGRAYPVSLLARMREPESSQLRLEDRHVDKVGSAAARLTGAGLLLAHAPRAMLDLNRAEDDVDWGMIESGPGTSRRIGLPRLTGTKSRARAGLGLVPRRLSGVGEIWRDSISQRELDARIEGIHRPYHLFLERELRRIRDVWGAALLVDLHSMPPLRQPGDGSPRPRIVLGDRFGATCDHSLVGCAFDYFEAQGCSAAYNRPYSGGYVVDRHSATRRNMHTIQIEVCRSTYLDENLDQTTDAVTPLSVMLAGLIRELGTRTAMLGDKRDLPQAAE